MRIPSTVTVQYSQLERRRAFTEETYTADYLRSVMISIVFVVVIIVRLYIINVYRNSGNKRDGTCRAENVLRYTFRSPTRLVTLIRGVPRIYFYTALLVVSLTFILRLALPSFGCACLAFSQIVFKSKPVVYPFESVIFLLCVRRATVCTEQR